MTDSASTAAALPIADDPRVNAGRMFRRTYGTFRQAPLRLMALGFIVFIVTIIQFLLKLTFSLGPSAANDFALLVGISTFALLLLRFALQIVTQNALIHATARILAGETARMGIALRVGFQRFFPALGVVVVAGLIVVTGLVLLVIPGIVLALAICLSVPACVLERRGPIESIKRSFYLTRDNRWRILAAGLVTLLPLLGAAILAAAAIAVAATWPDEGMALRVGVFAGVPLLLIVLLVSGVISRVFATVLFVELRRLKDGIGSGDALISVFN